MYARVPVELQPVLIANLKRLRVRSMILQGPIVLLVVSALFVVGIWIKGHFIIEILEDILGSDVTQTKLLLGVIGLSVILTLFILIYHFKENLLHCRCQNYHYCPKCNAVDNYDEGNCHICAATLSEKDSFFYTTDKKEIATLKRIGLPIYKEARLLSSSTERDTMGS